MARARLLKPGFFKNEELAALRPPPDATSTPAASFAARICFEGLWTLADRRGRLEDRPMRLKADIFPYDAVDMETLLTTLNDAGFISRYTVNGDRYIWIPKFLKHQSPHIREADSVIPAPSHKASTVLAPDEASPRSPVPKSVPVPETESESESEAFSGVGEGQEEDLANQHGESRVDRLLKQAQKKGVSRGFRGRL